MKYIEIFIQSRNLPIFVIIEYTKKEIFPCVLYYVCVYCWSCEFFYYKYKQIPALKMTIIKGRNVSRDR